jgi:carbonic anhydrase
LLTDLDRLRDAPQLPGTLTVSALLYDVKSGRVEEIAAPQTLAELRTQRDGTAAAAAT